MAAQPKEYFDIETAAKKDSYLIDTETLAPEVLASKFKKFSGVEKVFYLTMIVALGHRCKIGSTDMIDGNQPDKTKYKNRKQRNSQEKQALTYSFTISFCTPIRFSGIS